MIVSKSWLIPCLLVFFCTLGFEALGAARVIRYSDIEMLVKENNAEIKAVKLETAAAEAQSGHFFRSFLPDLNLQGGIEDFDSDSVGNETTSFYGVEARINLFNGGRDHYQEAANLAKIRIAKARAGLTQQDSLLLAQRLYWQILAAQKAIESTKLVESKVKGQLSRVNRKASRGVIPKTDLLFFNAEISHLHLEREQLILNRRAAENSFKLVLGLPDNEAIVVEGKFFRALEALPSAKKEVTKHPIVKREIGLLEQASVRSKQKNAWWLPRIDLYGAYRVQPFREREFENSADRRETFAGVMLTLPLSNSYQEAPARKEANYSREAQALRRDFAQRDLINHHRNLVERYRFYQNEVKDEAKRSAMLEKFLNAVFSEYDRGVRSTADLIGAMSAYRSAMQTYIEAQLQGHALAAELAFF